MTARDDILASVRRSLHRRPAETAGRAAVEARLRHPRANLIPQRARAAMPERIDLFCTMATEVESSIDRLGGLDEIPSAVAAYLVREALPVAVRRADHPDLAGLDWATVPRLTLDIGAANGSTRVGLSVATAGIAETGTLVMVSGPAGPTTLTFLSDHHLVVLRASTVCGSHEDVWTLLRAVFGPGELPRTVNLVTGPSRSGDIGQELQLGAHGPRRLHILLVDDIHGTASLP